MDCRQEFVIAKTRPALKVSAMSEAAIPPPLPEEVRSSSGSLRLVFLSLLIVVFVITGAVSLLDDTLQFFNRTDLTLTRALLLLLMVPLGLITYLFVASSPGLPKRILLTLALFIPVTNVAVLPLLVYFHEHALWISWGVSLLHVLTGVWMIRHLKTGPRIAWPLLTESRIGESKFRFGHFAAVILAGLFLIIPALLAYTTFSAKLAISHLTDGFVKLRASGIAMDVREYVRDDGKKITLVPMSHVGEAEFYEELSHSFPDDAVILLEGVSDNQKLFTVQGGYSKMAEAAGVVEQQKHFKPKGRLVPADMDMSEFSKETLEMLKGAMLVHSKGITEETLPILMKPAPPDLRDKLMDDILTKRNHHLLKVIERELPDTREIIIPWGAAHMPEIAEEIQKTGFKPVFTREMMSIRFWN